MIVVYTPADGEPQHYDASTLRVSEAKTVQRTVDMTWQEILEGLERDDLEAMRGIVWVLRQREDKGLRYGDFDPGVTELTSRMDKREVEAYLDNAFRLGGMNDDMDVETVADILLRQLPDVAADPEHARSAIQARLQAPKDVGQQEQGTAESNASTPAPTSNSPETDTSDFSPTSSTSLPEESTS